MDDSRNDNEEPKKYKHHKPVVIYHEDPEEKKELTEEEKKERESLRYRLNVEMARALIRNQYNKNLLTKAEMKKVDELADKMIADHTKR